MNRFRVHKEPANIAFRWCTLEMLQMPLFAVWFVIISVVSIGFAPSVECMSLGKNNFLETDRVPSPDGRLELFDRCQKEPENSERHPCTIVLRNLKTGTLKPIYDWDRDDSWNGGIDVFWSPSSKAVILNNYISSNTGESVLFIVETRFERVNLSAEVFTAHPTNFDWNYAHEYPAGTWVDSDTIRLKLTGHHDTEAGGVFTYTYIYKLNTRSSRLVKHVEGFCNQEHDLC